MFRLSLFSFMYVECFLLKKKASRRIRACSSHIWMNYGQNETICELSEFFFRIPITNICTAPGVKLIVTNKMS